MSLLLALTGSAPTPPAPPTVVGGSGGYLGQPRHFSSYSDESYQAKSAKEKAADRAIVKVERLRVRANRALAGNRDSLLKIMEQLALAEYALNQMAAMDAQIGAYIHKRQMAQELDDIYMIASIL